MRLFASCDTRAGPILIKGSRLEQLCRGELDNATHQISKDNVVDFGEEKF